METRGSGGGGGSNSGSGSTSCPPPYDCGNPVEAPIEDDLPEDQDYLSSPPLGVPNDVYDKINESERKLCWANPINCLKVYNTVVEAEEWSMSLMIPGQANGAADAMRHAFWNALMTYRINITEAKKWADAHEHGTDLYQRQMDLYNNNVGRGIGQEVLDQNGSESDLKDEIQNAYQNGELCIELSSCSTIGG